MVIDPGHGGSNLGAPNPRDPGGLYERHYALIIARRVVTHLREAGVETILTRTADVDMSIQERIFFANRHNADVFVSIHLNATDVPGPSGHETFFLALEASDKATKRLVDFENLEGGTVEHDAGSVSAGGAVDAILLDLSQTRAHHDSEKLAMHIQRRMVHASPFKDRGVKQAPFYVLMGMAMPAVVTEIGFINHPREGPYITSEPALTKIPRAIADGILDFGRLVLAPRQIRDGGK